MVEDSGGGRESVGESGDLRHHGASSLGQGLG